MVFPVQILWLFLAAMLISSIGFKHYIWFFSIGYGFAIAGEGLLLLLCGKEISLGALLCCLLLIAYGLRLGGYLTFREWKIGSYKTNMKGEIKDSKTVPFGVKIAIWIACATLYVLQAAPVLYRILSGKADNAFVFIGAAVMAFGLWMETAADVQKSRAKKVNSRRFVNTGLYRFVRCPNYLGEMLFWTGTVISGVGAVTGWQWALVALGYALIAYVMFSGARRLEIRQNRNYGADPEYQQYVKTVPILVPFVPLYSVEKYKWLVA